MIDGRGGARVRDWVAWAWLRLGLRKEGKDTGRERPGRERTSPECIKKVATSR